MSDSPRPITSLDDLFADSMQAQRKTTLHTLRNAKPEPRKPIKVSERYALPENWIEGRAIALMHEETQTLLGNFREYTHKTESAARKLIRLEQPEAVAILEYVRGPAWLGTRQAEIPAPSTWTTKRDLVLPDLLLKIFDVHAEAVGVVVSLQWGGIVRVQLAKHTTFHSPDANVALTLPAETNLLEVMDLEAKVELRRALAGAGTPKPLAELEGDAE